MLVDRRKHRSDNPLEAAAIVLARAARRAGSSAVALAIPDGRLVAGVGHEDADLEALAQLGTAYAGHVPERGFPDGLLEDVARGRGLFTTPLRSGGYDLVVTSVGAPVADAMTRAALDRIFEQP